MRPAGARHVGWDQGPRHRAGRRRRGRGVRLDRRPGRDHGRPADTAARRIERDPPVAREVDLHPRVGVLVANRLRRAVRGPRAGSPAPGAWGSGVGVGGPQQDRHRRRVVEAVALPRPCEALHGAGPSHRAREVGRCTRRGCRPQVRLHGDGEVVRVRDRGHGEDRLPARPRVGTDRVRRHLRVAGADVGRVVLGGCPQLVAGDPRCRPRGAGRRSSRCTEPCPRAGRHPRTSHRRPGAGHSRPGPPRPASPAPGAGCRGSPRAGR